MINIGLGQQYIPGYKITLPDKKADEAMIKLLCQLIPFEEDYTIQQATVKYFNDN